MADPDQPSPLGTTGGVVAVPVTSPWTERQLAEWRDSLPADWPDWRRSWHEDTRRASLPTYAECRARLRIHAAAQCITLHVCRSPSGALEPKEGHLTQAGIEWSLIQLRRLRREHTSLIAAERRATQ